MKKANILVVEDQKATSSLMHDILSKEGYEVKLAATAQEASDVLKRGLPELVILDLGLPDGDGLALCQELRGRPEGARLPILIVTARKSTAEKVLGLKSGADDYLAKPFNTEELVARVEALLRRSGQKEEPASRALGELKLERNSREAFLSGKPLALSATEFDLMWLFMARRGNVLTRDFLLQHVWGYEEGTELTTKVVDVTISHLRAKLGELAHRISAVRGFGYRLD